MTRYSVLAGQGGSLRCDRGYQDTCPVGPDGCRTREICSSFPVSHKSKPEEQFKIQSMVLDLNRYLASCRAGYTVKEGEEDGEDEDDGEYEEGEEGEEDGSPEEEGEEEAADGPEDSAKRDHGEEDLSAEEHLDVAAYPLGVGLSCGGAPQLRVLQLWLACSQAGRALRLRTPELVGCELKEEYGADLPALAELLRKKGITVGQLFGLLQDDRAIFAEDGAKKALQVLKSHCSFGV